MLFFAGTLFPVLGFLNVYWFNFSYVADHFQYLASLGIIVLASAGAALMANRGRPWHTRAVSAGCLVALATLAGLTWRQSQIYSDVETLYRTVITENPDCWLAHNNLGVFLVGRGRLDEAIIHYQRALEIKTDYAYGENNLGTALARLKRFDEAVVHFRKALEIQPGFVAAHNNLSIALCQQGKIAEAIAQWDPALGLRPENAVAVNFLAWTLATSPDASIRDGAKAVALAERAAQVTGGLEPNILDTLAAAYAEAGRFADAMPIAERALALASGSENAHLAETVRSRIKLYQSGSPYHETGPPTTP